MSIKLFANQLRVLESNRPEWLIHLFAEEHKRPNYEPSDDVISQHLIIIFIRGLFRLLLSAAKWS